MTALLEVRNLRAAYAATKVLQGIDFRVDESEVVALLGANGAGKTTTLRALCAMVQTEGEVTLAGISIQGKATEEIVRLGVAHVPDGRGTFSGMTVDENLSLGGYLRKDRADLALDRERMYSYFPRLKERRNQQAGTLSGGEQQMLALARALMSRPRLLLLDEPSFGLAPLVVRDIFSILARVRKEEGMSILIVEQNAAAALDLADRAYLLETGRIVLSGDVDSIKSNDAVRRSYLGY